MVLSIATFQHKAIRRHWDEEHEKWLFSVTDVVSVLSNSVDPLAYWRKLKERLKKDGSETVTKCHGLKMMDADGKMRLTDDITFAWAGLTTFGPLRTRRKLELCYNYL